MQVEFLSKWVNTIGIGVPSVDLFAGVRQPRDVLLSATGGDFVFSTLFIGESCTFRFCVCILYSFF